MRGLLWGVMLSVWAGQSVAAENALAACGERAEVLLSALDAGDFAGARGEFDGRMRNALSATKLKQLWISLPEQAGERQGRGALRMQALKNGAALAIIPLQYQPQPLDFQVTCSGDGKIAGMFLKPPKAPAAVVLDDKVASYVRPETFSDTPFELMSGDLALPAVLSVPRSVTAGRMPAVVLVHGSGSHDRDERIGPNRPFRDLAMGLASRGIVVVRYDKRALVAPQALAGKAFTVREEVIDDAVAAVAHLRTLPSVDPERIYVLGHSLGGLVAPRIAEADGRLAGLIFAAAPTRPMTTLIREQVAFGIAVDGKVDEAESAAAKQMNALCDRIDGLTAADRDDLTLLMGVPAAYWLDLQGYDPVAALRGLQLPALVLQGDDDFQVTVKGDYPRWEESAIAGLKSQRFARLNHLFMPSGDRPSAADYQTPGHVDAGVVDAIASWIDKAR